MNGMVALVSAVRPHPASVLDRLSDVVAADSQGLALFDGLVGSPLGRRNSCRHPLRHPPAREIFADGPTIARGSVAQLGAADVGHLHSPELHALVPALSAGTAEFTTRRQEHTVTRRRSASTRIVASEGTTCHSRHEVPHLPG